MQPRFHPLALFWPGALALLIVAAAAVLWATPAAAQRAVQAPAQSVHDFDRWCKWRRGTQPWGSLTQSDEQVQQGASAGKLAYDFPDGEEENFVVFQCAKPLTGTPEYLSMWVYGDGSGNLLNAWVQDATGLRWQFAFGPVDFTGWQRMTAHLAPGQTWPNGPLDGSDADAVVYPLRFDGLVLDHPGSDASSGEIYLDDLQASSLAGGQAAPPPSTPTPGKQALQPTPTSTPTPTAAGDGESGAAAATGENAQPSQDPEVDFRADPDSIEAGQCTTLRWTVRHVREYFVEGEGQAGDSGEQDVCPEETTTYTLHITTLNDEQQDYTATVEVTGEPAAQITVDDAEVLEEPVNGDDQGGHQGVADNSGVKLVAVANCSQARKLKCSDMRKYPSNPSFGKSTQACLVWVEEGAPFGAIGIAVRRQAPDPVTELWTDSRDSLGGFACVGLPIKISKQGSYSAVVTAKDVNRTVNWSVK